jgi:hypothetical protein
MSKTSVTLFEIILVYFFDSINIVSARITPASAVLLLVLGIVLMIF